MNHHLAPCTLLTLSMLSAQTAWTQLTPALSPPAFTAHAMAYFLPTDSTVLFGGQFAGVRYSDTWLFDGSNWTQANPATVPPARVAHTLCYDSLRARLVMFGGLSASGATLGDTWEWDGSDWTQMNPATSPPPRWAHCMAFHPLRGTTLLFGGYSGGNVNDLWEWNGVDWAPIVTASSPSPRRATDMAFDTVTGNMLLFSGYLQTNDTFLFDGTNWVQQFPATSPPARYDHTMETDLARNRVVLYGNLNAADTWEWNGATWIDRTSLPMPAPRVDTYLAYDWVREEMTMFGSSPTPETWRYAPVTPATYTVAGGGCPGTNGLSPSLSTTLRPWLGETFAVTIGQLPNNSIALMISGLSDTMWALGSLPASLAAIGMPGCLLQVDPFLIDAILPVGNTAVWMLPIPQAATLLGAQFFNQGGALDVGANAANLIVGNHGAAVIGGK
ncbi:MAG TPA: kelch repeat-containing protein [Planctomycetota bacterium]|nr:kelch repeat-containing protein [Planctomycetota bacterium]